MNFNLSDYTKLLTGFSSSIFSILLTSILAAIVSLIVVLLLMFIFKSFILVKRRHIVLRVISISYFVLIPIITAFFVFKWSLANAIENELKKNVTTYAQPLDAEFKAGLEIGSAYMFNSSIEDAASKAPYSANTAIDKFSDGVYNQYSKLLDSADLDKENFSGKTANLILRITKGSGISYAIKNGIQKLVQDEVGLDKNVTQQVMDVKFNDLINQGLFSKIISIQIDHFFSNIKKSILLLYCIVLFFPFVEICIAYWLFRKQKRIDSSNNISIV